MPNPDDLLEARRPVRFKGTVTVTPSATVDTNGTVATLTPDAGHTITALDAIKVVASGVGVETATLTVTATFDDATTATFTDTGSSTNTFDEANHGGGSDLIDLSKDGHAVTALTVALQSSIPSSTASYVVTLYGTQA